VLALRTAAAAGVPEFLLVRMMAAAWDVSDITLRYALGGRTWAHVGGHIRPPKRKRVTRVGHWFCPLDGFELEANINRIGEVVTKCVGCERRRAGRCMDCGIAVANRAWRCPLHRRLHQNQSVHECDLRHSDEYRAANRRRYFGDPVNRQRKLDYKREWRRANPKKVLMQKRRARLAGKTCGWATREKYLAYHAAYRERNREKLRANMRRRARYYEQAPQCRDCSAPIDWTPGKGRPALRCPAHNPWRKAS
jgi:hypothetical protein